MGFSESGQTFYLASRRNEGSLPTGFTPSLSQSVLESRRRGFHQQNRLPGFGFPIPFPWEQLGPSPYTPDIPGLPQLMFFPFVPHGGGVPNIINFYDDPDRPFSNPDVPRTFPTGVTGPSGGGGGVTGPTVPTGPTGPGFTSSESPSTFSSSSFFSSSSPAPTGGAEIEQMSVLGPAGVSFAAIGRWNWRDTGDPFPGGGV